MLQRAGVDVPDKELALKKKSRSAEPIASTLKFLETVSSCNVL
jgi:hypothetical protein